MRSRCLAVTLATASAFAATAGTAHAVHWPFFGGDAGRSGLQPVDEGATPLAPAYSLTGEAQRNVVTPIITTAGGGPAVQRIAFGTKDAQGRGRVHLRTLATGDPVGDPAGVVVDEADGEPFGGAGDGFADSSTATASGQLFVVHNDTGEGDAPDVEIAQIDQVDGTLVREFDVPGTNGVAVESAAVLTGPDAQGGRILFFVGSNGEVFRVPIAAAGSRSATFGTVTETMGAQATPAASPTIANLRDAIGAAAPHVAVGTTDARVRTFRVADLGEGPESEPLERRQLPTDAAVAQTPSVPVAPDGMLPGQAPALYVAVGLSGFDLPFETTVHKLRQEANTMTLADEARSPVLRGRPAPAIAVASKATADAETDSRLVVTTSDNLYTLETRELTGTRSLVPDDRRGAATEFESSVALVAGQFAYVTNAHGRQFVLRLIDAQPVPEAEFLSMGDTGAASGQPALSRGFVQFGTAGGLFVYRNRDLVAPATAVTAPAEGARATGTISLAATASDARGIRSVTFRVRGKVVGTDSEPDAGSPFNAMSPATFSVALDTRTLPDGAAAVTAEASDGTLATVSPERSFTVANGSSGTTPPSGADGEGGDGGEPVVTGRVRARRITAKLRPRRDRRAPYRFTVSGRVFVPSLVNAAQACAGGRMSIRYRAGRRTLSHRRVRLSSSCRYRSTVRFRTRRRFGRRTKLSVRVRFLGSNGLRPQRVRRLAPRVR